MFNRQRRKTDRDSGDRKNFRERREKMVFRKRACRFCVNPDLKVDYKDGRALSPFITERGRIVPSRISNNCAYHQRKVNEAIKRARILAIVPYTATQVRW
jgi:small subunit ribosomal protein S18